MRESITLECAPFPLRDKYWNAKGFFPREPAIKPEMFIY